jgi:molybdopterin-binding protein
MELLKPQDAARLMNVSYPTLKQWIYKGRVQSVKTPGGHHRIPLTEIERFSKTSKSKRRQPAGLQAISGRNKLLGTVTEVLYEGLLAQVTMKVGAQLITSIITRDACQELKLRKGLRAFALIKATEVMMIRG